MDLTPPVAVGPSGPLATIRSKARAPVAAVLAVIWLVLLGSGAAVVPALVVAVLWWGRPLAMAGLFMAAIALALWIAPVKAPAPSAPTFQPYVERPAAAHEGGVFLS